MDEAKIVFTLAFVLHYQTGGYAVDFMARGNEPGIKFDIRFMDTKTEIPGDHSWRMGSTVDENDATWDRKWHHVRIP